MLHLVAAARRPDSIGVTVVTSIVIASKQRNDLRALPKDYSTLVKTPTALLSRDYSKMIKYFGFILHCTTTIILGATTYYLYSLIKMDEVSINELLSEVPHEPPKSKVKRQKLIKCILTGNSKHDLGKDYTKE